ncbi:GNAT family N-acetyltransferase [Chitinophaga sp. 22321]|uniref:GNAT family N-acetyltransferase n=1 Tax=Chitinophaga hostae TaxID=2831022 RepID=A0ABS5J6L3_9BACT|nr:GNAT family N-acetyltransferase [Chitinophaga hostae]MBS0030859.1 GNAT family N-acetyltransferase [Chitinophaga hostae]
MTPEFRKAKEQDATQIWSILEKAIARRKADGSEQWQNGYPNPEIVESDINKGYGYILADGETMIGYCAVMINDEPAYADIKGQWLTDGDFVVYHRVAIAEAYLGKGMAQEMMRQIENYALTHHISSIRVDTNFDNKGMLHLFDKLGYTYCGEVILAGAPRKAYEKVLPKK